MRIKEILRQNRRDFLAKYECEHCGHTHLECGYDDTNFHKNVIPEMVCNNCNNKSSGDYEPLETKYPDGLQL